MPLPRHVERAYVVFSTVVGPLSPHRSSPRELQDVLEAQRGADSFFVYRDDHGTQRLFILSDQRFPVTIGRQPNADICLPWDAQVSAVHAELRAIAGVWTLIDDGLSANGTYIDGERLAGRHRLRDRSMVRVGTTVLYFQCPSNEPSGVTARSAEAPSLADVTPGQKRILLALCRPYHQAGGSVVPATNPAIAKELFLSEEAVKKHLRLLFQRFELAELPQNEKRTRLAEFVQHWGIVSPRDY